MHVFLLDTDHVVILQTRAAGDFDRLVERMGRYSEYDFHVSIVTFHEQVLGWNTYIARAKKSAGVVRGYTQLYDLFSYFRDAQVLPFDKAAAGEFDVSFWVRFIRAHPTAVSTRPLPW